MTACQIKLLTPTARMPERGSPDAAGLDVRADFFDADGSLRRLKDGRLGKTLQELGAVANHEGQEAYGLHLAPGERVLIPTGIAMATSPDIYTRVAPRSGLALKNGIDVLAGVVDADYRNEVGVLLINTDAEASVLIHHGMRVAQLVFERVALITPDLVDDLPETLRGQGGFGSTGTA